MSYNPQNPNSQATMANSSPVVIASDQTAIPVTANAGTNLNTSALALDATLTGGTQKTKIVDSAGTNVATVSAGGAVKVDGSAVTQPVSGTVTANNTTQKNASPVSTTMQNAAIANGNGTNLATDGYSTAIISITASVAMSGGTTINFEASTDNTTFVAVQATNVGTNTIATTTTATGDWQVDVTGYSFLRARISAYSAGTITVKGWPVGIPAAPKVINTNVVSTSGTQTVSGTVAATQSGTWTVQPGNTANTTAWKVDGSAVTQPVSGTVSVTGVAQDASVTGLQVTQGSTTSGQKGTLAQGAVTTGAPTYTTGQTSPLSLDASGNLRVLSTPNSAALDVGAGNIGSNTQRIVIATDQPANTNSLNVNLKPAASGGWTAVFANAITTTVTISSAAGKFGGYMLINLNAAPAYLQVFDTTGVVTLGTTTPTFVIPIPANSTAANGLAANLELANGVAIASGIKMAATTTANGATTVTTGLSGSIWYK